MDCEEKRDILEGEVSENMNSENPEPKKSSEESCEMKSPDRKEALGSSKELDNIDNIHLQDKERPEKRMPESHNVEAGDKSNDDSESSNKSHSEDKVILFDPNSCVREMQLKEGSDGRALQNRRDCTTTCMQKRNLIALLSFFGFFNVYCLRVDLSITLVAMTNPHTRITLNGDEYMVSAVPQ